ncbi:hypothetical protein C8J57DRAFT_1508371 [Mycena rebaudengoi]|nr:hypothetical protein C8J57DRAFT_1508371 [Mycena rebaudengoi]
MPTPLATLVDPTLVSSLGMPTLAAPTPTPTPLATAIETAAEAEAAASGTPPVLPTPPPIQSGLTWDNYPPSRPLANPPDGANTEGQAAPTRRGRPPGKAKERGRVNAKAKAKENPRKRKAAEELWCQTYNDDGWVIPLEPGSLTGLLSKKRRKELLDISKGLDAEKTAAEALVDKMRRMLANPDGNYPAVIWAPPPSEKRARRALVDRNGERVVAWEADSGMGSETHKGRAAECASVAR